MFTVIIFLFSGLSTSGGKRSRVADHVVRPQLEDSSGVLISRTRRILSRKSREGSWNSSGPASD
ncbi:hypothetical protein J6590_016379 [Homalodisca vitripennis]|nr:hypothetical protein J6590_016379 [Homalodisca vitripennis]